MYRLQNNVPNYLINESRDFQLLCRLYDCNNNGVKFNIDSIVRVMDTTSCGNSFLRLLETRLGFFAQNNYTDEEIRDVLMGFCDAVKYKGTKLGVERAVMLFLLAKNLNVDTKVDYKDYTFKIGFRTTVVDTSLLSDILKYILPAGCMVNFYYYREDTEKTQLDYGNRLTLIESPDIHTSRIVNTSEFYTNSSYSDNSSASWNFDDLFNTSTVDGKLNKDAVDKSLSNLGVTNIYHYDVNNSNAGWNVSVAEDTLKKEDQDE